MQQFSAQQLQDLDLPRAQPAATGAAQPIVRKPRISMRDPQQAIADFEFPAFDPMPGGPQGHAQAVVDTARQTAEQMLAQARAAAAAELDAARARGYEEGYREGLDQADREAAGLLSTAEAIASNVAREREELLDGAEADIVELAIQVAQRLVNGAIDVEPERVVDVCRGAMRKAFQRETLVVLAHPDDLAMLRAAGPALADELGGIHQLDFVEERRLQRGSVIVRTPVGEIDATFASKADKIHESLRELVQQRVAERREAVARDSAG